MQPDLRWVVFASAALAITIGISEWTPLDLELQHWLFGLGDGAWPVSRDAAMPRWLFYDGPRMVLYGYALVLLALLVKSRLNKTAAVSPRALLVALGLLILLPGVVGLLKATTHTACPRQLTEFGGYIDYRHLFETLSTQGWHSRARCFPAGHACGGYALMGSCWLAGQRLQQRLVVVFAVVAGSVIGGYKMLVGDHFLSHTLVSLWLGVAFLHLLGTASRVSCSPRLPPASRNR